VLLMKKESGRGNHGIASLIGVSRVDLCWARATINTDQNTLHAIIRRKGKWIIASGGHRPIHSWIYSSKDRMTSTPAKRNRGAETRMNLADLVPERTPIL
jgi:hypothetical protein